MTVVLRAWLILAVSSAATTGMAFLHWQGALAALAILAVAVIKARVILSDYLGLSTVPPVRRGFVAAILLWTGIAVGLVLLP